MGQIIYESHQNNRAHSTYYTVTQLYRYTCCEVYYCYHFTEVTYRSRVT